MKTLETILIEGNVKCRFWKWQRWLMLMMIRCHIKDNLQEEMLRPKNSTKSCDK